jgi:DUF1016 N-terminal domain
MSKGRKLVPKSETEGAVPGYDRVLGHVVELLESARRTAARSINAVITATYWEIGRRIVEFEQGGEVRSAYGAKVIGRLSADLSAQFGRGFSKRNLEQMRLFYLHWSIAQTLSAQSAEAGTSRMKSAKLEMHQAPSSLIEDLASQFPLPWSHYAQIQRRNTMCKTMPSPPDSIAMRHKNNKETRRTCKVLSEHSDGAGLGPTSRFNNTGKQGSVARLGRRCSVTVNGVTRPTMMSPPGSRLLTEIPDDSQSSAAWAIFLVAPCSAAIRD